MEMFQELSTLPAFDEFSSSPSSVAEISRIREKMASRKQRNLHLGPDIGSTFVPNTRAQRKRAKAMKDSKSDKSENTLISQDGGSHHSSKSDKSAKRGSGRGKSDKNLRLVEPTTEVDSVTDQNRCDVQFIAFDFTMSLNDPTVMNDEKALLIRTFRLLDMGQYICPQEFGISSCRELTQWCAYDGRITQPQGFDVSCQELCEVNTQFLCPNIRLEHECMEDILPPPPDVGLDDDAR